MFSQDPALASAMLHTMRQQEEARLAKEKRLRDAAALAKSQLFKRYKLTSKRLNPSANHASLNNEDSQAQKNRAPESQGPGFNLLADVAQPSSKPLLESIESIAYPAKVPGLKFFVFGCHGDGKENQATVARLMEKIAANPAEKPDFILMLGDNFYDSGVKNAEDPAFKTHFEDVYKKFKALNIPTFSILGNHDEDIHSAHIPGTAQGVEVGMHQVDHSYLDGNPYIEDTLDLEKLPLWNMPSRAYSIYHDDMEIICVDSNTYAKDYLAYVKGDRSESNQVVWVQKTYAEAKSAGRKVQLALHHPFETEGKRRFKAEAKMYLTEDERNEFRRLIKDLPHKSPHNDYVKAAFEHQHLLFDAIYSAHDHHQAYIKKTGNYPVTQIIAGGGGGDLQPRLAFRNQENMGVFLKENGFVSVKNDEKDPKALNFQFHSIENPEAVYEFTNQSATPVREYSATLAPEEIEQIKAIEALVRATVDDYLIFLGKHQDTTKGKFITLNLFKGNISHGKDGIDRAHHLWAYITQKKADNYQTTLETIEKITAWTGRLTSSRPHSLTNLLNVKLIEAHKKSLKELISDEIMEKKALADGDGLALENVGSPTMRMNINCSA